MALTHRSSQSAERTIALSRVVLGGTALFAVWLDPAEPTAYAPVAYAMHWLYVAYALVVIPIAWRWQGSGYMPVLTQYVDIVAFSVFQYLSLGPSSPFFVYFVFSMFCGAIRWGWRGSVVTGGLVVLAYVGMAVLITSRYEAPLELDRFVIRIAYLAVATGMLVYLGRYEETLRSDIERLARWPSLSGDARQSVERVLEYAARMLGAERAVAVWEATEEPVVHEARWSASGFEMQHWPPEQLVLLPEAECDLRTTTFLCGGDVREATSILLGSRGGGLRERPGMPIAPEFMPRLAGPGLATAPLRTDTISGRVFLSGFGVPSPEVLALTKVVAREVAGSFDQIHAAHQREELATREQRVRVARDLHDGVLQALTGVRLELRALAATAAECTPSTQDRLVGLERALALEQRELRLFIEGLEPDRHARPSAPSPLRSRLEAVRERIGTDWKMPVVLRVDPALAALPGRTDEALPLMVHEAAVNALKHGRASRVAVDVRMTEGQLRVTVSDDGCGFGFKGRREHDVLQATGHAPRSLLTRVEDLGGRLAIESSPTGSRVEMLLSL